MNAYYKFAFLSYIGNVDDAGEFLMVKLISIIIEFLQRLTRNRKLPSVDVQSCL